MEAMDFGFSFNNVNYSNTTLRIVILPDDHDKPSSDSICRKRLHDDSEDLSIPRKKQKHGSDENIVVAGDEFAHKLIHVNSIILGGRSLFFRKMFSNGMKESQQQHTTRKTVSIHIRASEEAAFMDLLKFMYSGKLSRVTPPALWDVAIAADKFDVPSCIKLCNQLLTSLPMTLELALQYVHLDSTGLIPDSIRPHLDDSAKNFLAQHFKEVEKAELQDELLELPLTGVEAVLSSDYLQVKSEDEIYDFIFKWVQTQYSNQLEERRNVLNMLVRRFLRFPFLSAAKMEDILTCTDIDPAIASKLVVEALRYHQALPPLQQIPEKFVKRAYKHPCLKVVAFDESSSHPQCIVYLDVKRDECENSLATGGNSIVFQPFFLGKHKLGLRVNCGMDEQDPGFGLFFTWHGDTSITFSCDLASIKKPSEKFKRIHEQNATMEISGMMHGWTNLFEIPWALFIGEDSRYFVNDILRLRIHLKMC